VLEVLRKLKRSLVCCELGSRLGSALGAALWRSTWGSTRNTTGTFTRRHAGTDTRCCPRFCTRDSIGSRLGAVLGEMLDKTQRWRWGDTGWIGTVSDTFSDTGATRSEYHARYLSTSLESTLERCILDRLGAFCSTLSGPRNQNRRRCIDYALLRDVLDALITKVDVWLVSLVSERTSSRHWSDTYAPDYGKNLLLERHRKRPCLEQHWSDSGAFLYRGSTTGATRAVYHFVQQRSSCSTINW
jgi:hypothetical protein